MTDLEIIIRINKMAEQSLSPEVFEKWEDVKKWLIINRESLQKQLTHKNKLTKEEQRIFQILDESDCEHEWMANGRCAWCGEHWRAKP